MMRPPRRARCPERDRVRGAERDEASLELDYPSSRLHARALATTMRVSRNLCVSKPKGGFKGSCQNRYE